MIVEKIDLAQDEKNKMNKAKKIEGVLGLWDVISFSRIGELRSDRDLIKAGVIVEHSVIIGK